MAAAAQNLHNALQAEAGFACRQPNHPICIIKEAIIEYFDINYPGRFKSFDDLYPIVSTKAVSTLSVCLSVNAEVACCNIKRMQRVWQYDGNSFSSSFLQISPSSPAVHCM